MAVQKTQPVPVAVQKKQSVPKAVQKKQPVPVAMQKIQPVPVAMQKTEPIPVAMQKTQPVMCPCTIHKPCNIPAVSVSATISSPTPFFKTPSLYLHYYTEINLTTPTHTTCADLPLISTVYTCTCCMSTCTVVL